MLVYCMHRYSQPNMLNHLKQFIDTGEKQQFRKANDVDCILYSFQGFFTLPSRPLLFFRTVLYIENMSRIWKQQAIRFFFFPTKAIIWLCAHLKVDFSNLISFTYSKCEGLSNNEYIQVLVRSFEPEPVSRNQAKDLQRALLSSPNSKVKKIVLIAFTYSVLLLTKHYS